METGIQLLGLIIGATIFIMIAISVMKSKKDNWKFISANSKEYIKSDTEIKEYKPTISKPAKKVKTTSKSLEVDALLALDEMRAEFVKGNVTKEEYNSTITEVYVSVLNKPLPKNSLK